MITIDYFSDVLCVWAYGGQIRLDEVRATFADQVLVRHRFMALFADTPTRIGAAWRDEGGFDGFGGHARDVCAQWPHVSVADSLWSQCHPVSCATAHVFLKAVERCLGLDRNDDPVAPQRDRYEALVAAVRMAFFAQGQDIAELDVLLELLPAEGPDATAVRGLIDSGEAYAALHHDYKLAEQHGVLGSPTYVFNEGRQLLYGNVGYRIIETNIRELLAAPAINGQPSWC
jgi:predicted DsbA family dithiol-disulfide isomerase